MDPTKSKQTLIFNLFFGVSKGKNWKIGQTKLKVQPVPNKLLDPRVPPRNETRFPWQLLLFLLSQELVNKRSHNRRALLHSPGRHPCEEIQAEKQKWLTELLLFTNFLSSGPKCTCKLFVWNNSSHTAETLTGQFQKESWSRQFQKRRVGRFFSQPIQILPSCVLNTWVEHQQSSEWVYIWLSSPGPCFHRLLVFSRSQPLDGSFYQTQHLLWCPIFHRNWKYLFFLTTSFSNCPGRWWFVQHDNIFLGSSLQVQSRRTCSNFCSNFCRLFFW